MEEKDGFQILKNDILQYELSISDKEWNAIRSKLSPINFKKGTVIFDSTDVCTQLLFICEGITASEYLEAGEYLISRFFQKRNICTNLVSLLSGNTFNDRLVSITPVKGLLIPGQLFSDHYYHTDMLGMYFRKKVIEILVEDKQFISIKTRSGVRSKLSFLQEQYPEILLEAPWKSIAAFMGVTPAWLSRVLKDSNLMGLNS